MWYDSPSKKDNTVIKSFEISAKPLPLASDPRLSADAYAWYSARGAQKATIIQSEKTG